MVIVDSSVWIDVIKGRETPETIAFKRLVVDEDIGLGDLILYEVLQGVKPASTTDTVKAYMLNYTIFTMGGRDLILEAVHNAQILRAKGIQVATVDCIIATFCLISGSRLLSSDNDFRPFADVLGLVLAR